MAKNMAEARELYQRALKYDRWPSKDLEEKLALMIVAIDCLERAWTTATLSFPGVDVLSLINDIEYALKRVHREHAYRLREKLRGGRENYFEDYAVMIYSILHSQKPLSHFCLAKNELKKWSALPFDSSGAVSLTTRQKFKLRWKVFKMRLVIHLRVRG